MKRTAFLLLLAVAAFAAVAGTRAPEIPVSGVSDEDATVDTMWGDFLAESLDRSLDTVLFDWALSPFPGIPLNTNPARGLFIVVK